jgi:hypothetical protein
LFEFTTEVSLLNELGHVVPDVEDALLVTDLEVFVFHAAEARQAAKEAVTARTVV